MILDLKSIFANEGSVLPIAYEMDLSSVEFAGGFPLKMPVKVQGSVSNRASMVILMLKITYTFSADCDRCGVSTERVHTLSLNKTLAVSVESEESDIVPVPGMELNVDELVFSEVYVDLPSKHLCNKNCKGICPKCGKNLNEGNCDCPTKEIDPRLSKLAELLND